MLSIMKGSVERDMSVAMPRVDLLWRTTNLDDRGCCDLRHTAS